MNTRDPWSERVFERFLHDRLHKYEPRTFGHYRHDAELGLIEGLSQTEADVDPGEELGDVPAL